MSYYDDCEDYYEPSEFDEKVDEFKDYLRGSVKDEIKKELEDLKKENQSLQHIKENWDKLEREQKQKLNELKDKLSACKADASRKRLDELFKETGMDVILYRVDWNSVYPPKCDKCDKDRLLHFVSPLGKPMAEECDCTKMFKKYSPKAYYMAEFRRNRYYESGKERTMIFWFKKYEDYSNDYDGYQYDSSDAEKLVYTNENYQDLFDRFGEYSSGLYFRSEEECQGYCDWLNNKNGITPDMKEKQLSVKSKKYKEVSV